MRTRSALSLAATLILSTAAAASNTTFSVSGHGGAIPDGPSGGGTWEVVPSWSVFTSTVAVANPVTSVTAVKLEGLTHTYRGDLHVFLTDPAGVRYNVIVRPGFNGGNHGDTGNYNLGDYTIVGSGGASLAMGSTDIGAGTYNQFLNSGNGRWVSGSYPINNTALNSISGPAGIWTLTIVDWWGGDLGSLTGWTFEGESEPGSIYFVSAATNTIHRVDLNGTGEVNLATSLTLVQERITVHPQSGKIYWASTPTNTIHRANLNGTGEMDLGIGFVLGQERISIDTQNGKMYWADAGTNTIHRANLDGTAHVDLGAGTVLTTPISLDVPGGKMYWGDLATNSIHQANLDGTLDVDLLAGFVFATPISLDLAGGKMYWADASSNTIHRANLDGSSEVDLGAGTTGMCSDVVTEAVEIALDPAGGKMYWADVGTGTIHRANLDGSSEMNLGVGSVFGMERVTLDLQGGKMYWADLGAGSVLRANLDGTSLQNLATSPVAGPCGAFVSLLVPPKAPMAQFCIPGVDTTISCPCSNPPAGGGLGCDNFSAGPAQSGTLDASGNAIVGPMDTLVLEVTGMNSTSLTVFFSGTTELGTTVINGAGLRCVGGTLKRLFSGSGVGGAIDSTMASPLGVSVSDRSAALNATIVPGQTRYYYNVYRDPMGGAACGFPTSTVNTTNAGAVVWN